MEENREIINVEPIDGRIIINLYGKDLEIHESMFDENGVAILKRFGKTYEIIKPVEKKKRTYTRKKNTEPVVENAVESGLEGEETASQSEDDKTPESTESEQES